VSRRDSPVTAFAAAPLPRRAVAMSLDRKAFVDILTQGKGDIGGTCWRPEVKTITIMVNSIYNGWRMEDVWLDR